MDQYYDEFGNYIGPEDLDSDESPRQRVRDSESEDVEKNRDGVDNQQAMAPELIIANQHRIVLHEDKKYYPTHQEMYPEAETLIQQQDAQTLQTPIVQTVVQKKYNLVQHLNPVCGLEFFASLQQHPKSIRNICVAGHLHHGKTLLMDMLIQDAFEGYRWDLEKNYNWLDSRVEQQDRKVSIKSHPATMVLQDLKGKHYALNFVDTPGHPSFTGQLSCALRVSDGVLLVVDAIEGVMMMTEKVIHLAIREKLKIVVFVNKIDRLILELKIPPEDAYLKIKHTLEEINGLLQAACNQFGLNADEWLISPLLGNVVFGSAEYSFLFSLESFAKIYSNQWKSADPNLLSKVFWGDYYFNAQSHKFVRKPTKQFRKRTFVEFILEPIYKIFAHSVGKDKPDLEPFLAKIGVYLRTEEYRLNIKPLIKLIFQRYMQNTSPLVSAVTKWLPSPDVATPNLLSTNFTGPHDDFYNRIQKCEATGPLFVNIVKSFHKPDCKSFYVFGRIISGTLSEGDEIRVLGEGYNTEQEEDVMTLTVGKLYISQGRYLDPVRKVYAGNHVYIEGIDHAVVKTATIVSSKQQPVEIMRPIKFWTTPVVKLAIEPLVPSDLPKMLEAIRKSSKSYPLMSTKVEESGEHIIMGTGEIEMDSILHDIRQVYSDVEVKISDPSVIFCETVVETSGIKCYADTPNKKNRITCLASPLEKGLADTIEKEFVSLQNTAELSDVLESRFEWDILASNNVWAFGPDIQGPNILINDSYPTNTNQTLLSNIKNSLVQGFRWSTKEGPLCDQPMRNVKFRIIDAELSSITQELTPGQLIPTARRAFYSAFLTATPRLMEPVLYTEIQCTQESLQAVYTVVAKRRGNITHESAKAGSPLYTVKATIPAVDSFGFETDLRVTTVGQAFCLTTFDHWNMLLGDPLDKKIVLRPLESHQPYELPREFMIKTRRRKGLNEQVSIIKYFDDLNIKELMKADASYRDFV